MPINQIAIDDILPVQAVSQPEACRFAISSIFSALSLAPIKPEEEASKMGTGYKSRTQKKKEDRALQRLGEQLVGLPISWLETMDLPDDLLTAIELAHKIKSRSARRRQMQHIGALMRHIDPQPIEAALERLRAGNFRQ